VATLTYWVAERLDDLECYNLRAKTKKEVVAMKAAHECASSYGEPKKVTVNYEDSFDLVVQCLKILVDIGK